MKKTSLKKRIFNFSTFVTSLVTVPLLLFVTYELLKTHDELTELKVNSENKYTEVEKDNTFNSTLLNSIFRTNVSQDKYSSVTVSATAYSAEAAQCDSSPHITANGELSTVGRIAVSRDLLDEIPLGSYVYIPNQGVFKVADVLNKRYTKRIDMLLANKKAAQLFGLKHNVKLYYFKG